MFHQYPSLDFKETFSLVIKPSTVWVVLSIAVSRQWDIRQLHVNNAFLNGFLHEDVYMKQPKGLVDPSNPMAVCKLHHSLMDFVKRQELGMINYAKPYLTGISLTLKWIFPCFFFTILLVFFGC